MDLGPTIAFALIIEPGADAFGHTRACYLLCIGYSLYSTQASLFVSFSMRAF